MDGWIKIYRDIKNHWIWQDPVKLKWWIDMLLTANHEDTKVNIGMQLIDCKRGQSVMSLANWAKKWKVSRDRVRSFFDLLEKDGMIAREPHTKFTQITICNYDSYQESYPTNSQQTHNKLTTNSQQTHINKNEKNEKNIYNIYNTLSSKNEKSKNKENKEPENSKKDAQKIVDMWNSTCISCPKVFTISLSRKNKIHDRIEEIGGSEKAISTLQIVFEKIQSSTFLRGGKHGWRASFDWLFSNDKNWLKVYEGNYDDKTDEGSESILTDNSTSKYDNQLTW